MPDRKGIVTADKLNVRSGPGTNYPVVCQLSSGVQVDIQGQLDGWKRLNLSDLEGYVNRAFIAITSPGSGNEPEIEYAIVEADALNVRSGPGYQFSTVAIVRKEEMVEVIKVRGDWLLIKSRRLTGFMARDLVVEIIGGGSYSGGWYLAAVNEELVNLRSGPGYSYAVVSVLPRDTQLKVSDLNYQWVQVETIQQQGYIRKDFVKRTPAARVELAEATAITTATVTTSRLSMRQGPDYSYSIFAYLTSGTQLRVNDMTTDWARIQPVIDPAYVYGKYISETTLPPPGELPPSNDPLKPPASEIISIGSGFSAEQVSMARTWNKYGGLIRQIATEFSLDPVVALAVFSVESGGKGFGSDGRMMIRFENHYFYHYWGQYNKDRYNQHFKFDANKTWRGHKYRKSVSSSWQDVHTGYQGSEWRVFEFASQLDRVATLQSISMGAPQIMGANYRLIGYDSAETMFHSFQSDIRNQIWGFFRFIESKNLVQNLRAEDFVAFAKVYNGSARATTYGNKIQLHVNEFRRISHLA